MLRRLFLLMVLIPLTVFAEVGSEAEAEEPAESVSPSPSLSPSLSPEAKATPNEFEESLSGTVKLIRKIGMTEVFFTDLKESYFIPSGSKNYSIFKAFSESQKKGTKVSFKVNKKSRQVVDIEAPRAATPGDDKKSGTK